MDTKSLKKIIVEHNKQYKEMLLSLKGGRKAILPLVEKHFVGKVVKVAAASNPEFRTGAGTSIEVKHKKGLSKYTVNLPGTRERRDEDDKFRASRARDLENRRKKVIRNKAKAKTADKKSQAKGAKKGVRLAKALSKVKGIKEKALTGATRMRLKKTGGKLTGKKTRMTITNKKTGAKVKGKKITRPTDRERKAIAAKRRGYKVKKAKMVLKDKKDKIKKIQKTVRGASVRKKMKAKSAGSSY